MGDPATVRVVISWEQDQWMVWIKLSFANGEPKMINDDAYYKWRNGYSRDDA